MNWVCDQEHQKSTDITPKRNQNGRANGGRH